LRFYCISIIILTSKDNEKIKVFIKIIGLKKKKHIEIQYMYEFHLGIK